MRIYITGFMGSGKTTFGKQLAECLGYAFTDLDQEVENAEQSTISAIFEEKGEDYFRKAEHEALLKTDLNENMVISTGGGTPCFHDNMQWMKDKGITVYLKLFESELEKRLKPELKNRPLLKNTDPDDLGAFIYKTLRERAYFYHQAQLVIDAMHISAGDLCNILKANYL